jgi:hypothetical protein
LKLREGISVEIVVKVIGWGLLAGIVVVAAFGLMKSSSDKN